MPPAFTTFDSTRESLIDLLRYAKDGRLQLPDFQRGWVWDDAHIRDLLASVSMAYPIGAVMMLQTGNPAVRFKPRPVEGVRLQATVEPERLILDGQQRLTSLYQALASGQVVATHDARNKPLRRWYYVDIAKALDPNTDREEAIVGVPEDKCIRSFRGDVELDLSSVAKECEAEMFPLSRILDMAALGEWMVTYVGQDVSKMSRWTRFQTEFIQAFQQYQVPLIVLRKETPKEAVCQVFEKVNTGGVSLTVFELVTATFAADDFNLRDDWARRERRLKRHAVLGDLQSTDFLQAITLLVTRERRQQAMNASTPEPPAVSCKRKDVLRLSLPDYQKWADQLTAGFEQAAKFLNIQRCVASRDVPYRTQLPGLAAILTALGPKAESDSVRQKLARWYWCGVLGELYGGAVETRLAKDVWDVVAWVGGGAEPSTVAEAIFNPGRLETLRTRNSAAYKGLSNLVLRDGGLDLRSGVPIDVSNYFNEDVDIHHIFPRAWCEQKRIEKRRADSIVNKTPLSASTNRMIGGKAPSQYLAAIEKREGITPDRMGELLASHAIPVEALRADDFDRFYRERRDELLARIERAMGKRVPGRRELSPDDRRARREADSIIDELQAKLEATGLQVTDESSDEHGYYGFYISVDEETDAPLWVGRWDEPHAEHPEDGWLWVDWTEDDTDDDLHPHRAVWDTLKKDLQALGDWDYEERPIAPVRTPDADLITRALVRGVLAMSKPEAET